MSVFVPYFTSMIYSEMQGRYGVAAFCLKTFSEQMAEHAFISNSLALWLFLHNCFTHLSTWTCLSHIWCLLKVA